MPETKHTPEPWVARGTTILGQDTFPVANCGSTTNRPLPERVANTERIVACVNACAGLTSAALEVGLIDDLIEVLVLAHGVADGGSLLPRHAHLVKEVYERLQGRVTKGGYDA